MFVTTLIRGVFLVRIMKLSLLFVLLFGFALAANAQDGDGGEMEGADDGDMGDDEYCNYLIDDGEGEGEGEEDEP